jgi:hypothetical protein
VVIAAIDLPSSSGSSTRCLHTLRLLNRCDRADDPFDPGSCDLNPAAKGGRYQAKQRSAGIQTPGMARFPVTWIR